MPTTPFSQISLYQLGFGILLAIIIALLARKAHALSRSGAVGAAILGTIIFGLGGLAWAILLLGFFISSSLLSRFFGKRKAGLNEKFSKGSERDIAQVAANGGVAGIFVLLHTIFPGTAWTWWGFAAALAAANADTWATELGVLSRSTPRLITTGKPVERGTSGGISWEGTLAAFSGSTFIVLLAILIPPTNIPFTGIFVPLLLISISGLAGCMVDSALGATLQAIYTCPTCKKETERHPTHVCGTPTILSHGLPWLNNDWVNIIGVASGAVLAVLFQFLIV